MWTEPLDMRFSHSKWNPETKMIVYYGDKLKIASNDKWVEYIYECHYNIATNEILDVKQNRGIILDQKK